MTTKGMTSQPREKMTKIKPTKFNFSNEITEYVKSLGDLCPDIYNYVPKIGDTVEIRFSFLGVSILKGVVVKGLPRSKKMASILKKLKEWDELDDADNTYLEETFDFMAEEPNEYTRGFCIEFSEKISAEFVQNKIESIGHLYSEMNLSSGKVNAKIVGNIDDGYLLTGLLRGFIDGHSVLSTQALDAFKKMHATKTNVENVAWSDRVLPAALLSEINESLDQICRDEPADFHPGSGKVVRDIVHPSMYCFVKGVSQVNGVPGNPLGEKPKESKASRNEEKDFWGRKYEDSIYQWLPAEFYVSEDGSVRIDSYVNNLDRQKYPNVYSTLERMFEKTLPMFEAVCGSLRNHFCDGEGEFGKRPNKPKSISLRNRTLQVVTKIVEYRVNHEANFDGVWHVEGMSHEGVLATALCIVKRDQNFAGAEIEFRRFLFAEEGDDLMSSTPQNARRPTDTMGHGDVRPLGCMKTPANRVVVFPNSHIHRLSSMYSSDGMDATRRIVVFWLVNPERPITSTANVPAQQTVISLDDALRNRLALMAERKLHKETYEEREVPLCEH